MILRRRSLAFLLLGLAASPFVWGWGHPGHQMVNRLALASLPKDFPNFVHTAAHTERVVYLGNVPDYWRNTAPALRQSGGSWTDHYINLELLTYAGLDPRQVSSFRLDFVLAFAAGRKAHPERFAVIDPKENLDHVLEWSGFAPWAMTEYFHKLRSAFSYLKAFEELGGTAEEITNARADAINAMGLMGHYIGDCAQPLHTTVHHDGWKGPNPHDYTTKKGIHRWMDSGLIELAGISYAPLGARAQPVQPLVLPAPAEGRDPYFVVAMNYILEQFGKVEAVYRMEKAGQLGNNGQPVSPEGRAFVEGQLLVGAQMLARTWLTAWKTAPVDTLVQAFLIKRQTEKSAPAGSAVSAGEKKKP